MFFSSTCKNSAAYSIPPSLYASFKSVESFSSIGIPIFNIFTNLGLVAYGIKEIVLDSHSHWFHFSPGEEAPAFVKRVASLGNSFFSLLRQDSKDIGDEISFSTHGLLMVGAGAAGTFSALGQLGAIGLGMSLTLLDFLAGGFFIFGNILLLQRNLIRFAQAWSDLQEAEEIFRPVLTLELISASLGIASNVVYIASSIAVLVSAPYLYPLVLGTVGILCGCVRLLLDTYIGWKTRDILEHSQIKV